MLDRVVVVCLGFALTAGTGCLVDTSRVPEGTLLECTSDDGCPETHTCVIELELCVGKEAVGDAPALTDVVLSPDVITVGGTATLTFASSAPLGAPPRVSLELGGGDVRAWLLDESDSSPDDDEWTFKYVARGDEAVATPRPVTVALLGANGASASGLGAGQLAFDFTPPRFESGPSATTGAFSPARPAEVSFTLDEDASESSPPSVVTSSAGGSWTAVDAGPRTFRFTYAPPTDLSEGDYEVTIIATDVAGNASVPATVAPLRYDETAPVILDESSVSRARVRPGQVLTAEVVADEALGVAPSVVLRAGTTELSLALDDGGADRFAYLRGILPGDPDGTYDVVVTGIEDRAGNPGVDKTIGQVTVDTTPPNLVLVSISPARVSQQSGYDVATVAVDVDENLDLGLAELSAAAGEAPMTCSAYQAASPNYSCTWTVGAGDVAGFVPVTVTARDGAGNVATVGGTVAIDLEGPILDSSWVHLEPAADNVLAAVTAGTNGTQVRVSFVLSEPLAASSSPPVVELETTGVSMTLVSREGTGFSYVATLAGLSADLELTDSIRITGSGGAFDSAGNPVLAQTIASVAIDTTPPGEADTLTEGRVVYERVPWGSEATGGLRSFRLRGAAGAVEPEAAVIIYDSAALDAEIGRTVADVAGGFAEVALASGDLDVVVVATADGAGNLSAPAEVRDITWVATLGKKVPGDSVRNPHDFVGAQVFTQAIQQRDALEIEAPTQVARVGDAWTTTGRAQWQRRRPQSSPFAGFPQGAVYDVRRNVVVMVDDAGELWEWDTRSWARIDAGAGPGAISEFALVYDARREVVVMFGGLRLGTGFAPLAETWEYDGGRWSQIDPPTSPTPRFWTAAAYDVGRGVTVLFGGDTGGAEDAQTWEYDGQSWREVTSMTSPPAARSLHAMAYDVEAGHVVLWGGYTGALDNDTWSWDGERWQPLTPSTTTPPVGERGSLFYDGGRDVLVLTGVVTTGGNAVATTYEWDGDDWSAMPARPAPAPYATVAAYVASEGIAMVHGGTSNGVDQLGTWTYDGAAWEDRTTSEAEPGRLEKHAMAYDASAEVTVLFGGDLFGVGPVDAVWEWTGYRWQQRMGLSSGPTARARHAMAYDGTASGVVVFGGEPAPSNVAHVLGASTTWLGPFGDAQLGAREETALAWDEANQEVVLFSGLEPAASPPQDTWTFSSGTWVEVTPGSGNPPPRQGHAMVYSENDGGVLLFGGLGTTGPRNDLWLWDGSAWSPLEETPAVGTAPAPRSGARMTYDPGRRRALLFGGQGADTYDDTWEWDGATWTERAPAGDVPALRFDHALAYDSRREQTLLHGGDSHLGDTWTLDAGSGSRPGHVVSFSFGDSRAEAADQIREVALLWTGGGTGYASADCSAVVGGAVRVLDGERWREVAATAASALAPAQTAWTSSSDSAFSGLDDVGVDARARAMFFGAARRAHFTFVPASANGCGSQLGAVTTDYVELTVRYRR